MREQVGEEQNMVEEHLINDERVRRDKKQSERERCFWLCQTHKGVNNLCVSRKGIPWS